MDNESFELINARALANGVIADSSDGIVSVLFSEPMELNGASVAEFTIKAKTDGTNLAIGFSVSVIDSEDNKIPINQADSILVTAKY